MREKVFFAKANPRLLRGAATVAALAISVVGFPNLWIHLSTRSAIYGGPDFVPSRTVVIVPGARASKAGARGPLADRLTTALELYRHGRAKVILVSGSETPLDPEVSTMTNWLATRGVPRSDIMVDARGTRTIQTMFHAAHDFGVRDAIVCTQDLHMARTIYLARNAGIDAVGVTRPTPLSHSFKWIMIEAAKNVLAYAESAVRGPVRSSSEERDALALR
jgi:vancomycin permeability regulator SanA